MALVVHGILTCSSCKKALKWLEEEGIEHEFVDTRQVPPDEEAIAGWVEALGSKSLRNTSGKSYRALGDSKKTWSDGQWIAAFAQDAMLLKRPLFEKDGEAVLVGFRAKEEVLRQLLVGD